MSNPIRPDDLVHKLAAEMRKRDPDWENSTSWTNDLKGSLKRLLKSEGTNVTEVLYSDRDAGQSEFLLDVVVWDRSAGEGVSLAVESEWLQNVEEVARDFWKLLVVKAPLKLMIFACNKKPRKFTQEAIWKKLSDCLLLYRDHVAGERYVFMDYAPRPGRSAWWIEIPSNGRLNTVPPRNWFEFD